MVSFSLESGQQKTQAAMSCGGSGAGREDEEEKTCDNFRTSGSGDHEGGAWEKGGELNLTLASQKTQLRTGHHTDRTCSSPCTACTGSADPCFSLVWRSPRVPSICRDGYIKMKRERDTVGEIDI
jgi:hypothetical protein